jgi:hypothetical protein
MRVAASQFSLPEVERRCLQPLGTAEVTDRLPTLPPLLDRRLPLPLPFGITLPNARLHHGAPEVPRAETIPAHEPQATTPHKTCSAGRLQTYHGRFPANRRPRVERRSRWPRGSPCAGPWALVRGKPGARVELEVTFHEGRRHLPIVTLRRAG